MSRTEGEPVNAVDTTEPVPTVETGIAPIGVKAVRLAVTVPPPVGSRHVDAVPITQNVPVPVSMP
jgi:hypothetical protein